MVAADDEDSNAGLAEPPELFGEKTRRLHRGLVAIVEISGDQERVDLLVQAKVDHPDEGTPGGVADQLRQVGMAQRKRAQG